MPAATNFKNPAHHVHTASSLPSKALVATLACGLFWPQFPLQSVLKPLWLDPGQSRPCCRTSCRTTLHPCSSPNHRAQLSGGPVSSVELVQTPLASGSSPHLQWTATLPAALAHMHNSRLRQQGGSQVSRASGEAGGLSHSMQDRYPCSPPGAASRYCRLAMANLGCQGQCGIQAPHLKPCL